MRPILLDGGHRQHGHGLADRVAGSQLQLREMPGAEVGPEFRGGLRRRILPAPTAVPAVAVADRAAPRKAPLAAICIRRDHGRLHDAFDHQGVAIGDLDALELDVGADGQLAAPLRARLGRHCNSSRGWWQRGIRKRRKQLPTGTALQAGGAEAPAEACPRRQARISR
jgi:hypothetical protein